MTRDEANIALQVLGNRLEATRSRLSKSKRRARDERIVGICVERLGLKRAGCDVQEVAAKHETDDVVCEDCAEKLWSGPIPRRTEQSQ